MMNDHVCNRCSGRLPPNGPTMAAYGYQRAFREFGQNVRLALETGHRDWAVHFGAEFVRLGAECGRSQTGLWMPTFDPLRAFRHLRHKARLFHRRNARRINDPIW